MNITWDDDEDECSDNDEYQNEEDNENSSSRILFTMVEENEIQNTQIDEKIREEETKEEDNEGDIQQASGELYELCETLTNKNKNLES